MNWWFIIGVVFGSVVTTVLLAWIQHRRMD